MKGWLAGLARFRESSPGIAGNLVLVDNSDSFLLERSKFSFLSAKPSMEATLRSVGVDFFS
jgi:hypothetical protein